MRRSLEWAAGLFEGEGSISIKLVSDKKGGFYGPYLEVSLTSTDEDVILSFCRTVGLGRVYGPYKRSGRKPHWVWAAYQTPEIRGFLEELKPYMHSRRRARIEEALDATS